MNRKEEYKMLLAQLEQDPPTALDNCVEKARKRARTHSRWKGLGRSLASLGGVAAAFVLAVNLSVPFALACARIPGLRELVANLAFSPSLKTAVENDHVQLIGQTQTTDGVTLKMEYLIFDPAQLHFFYTVSGGDYDSFHVHPTITGPDGEKLEGYGITSAMSLPGELSDFGVTFNEGFRAPAALKLTCRVTGHRERTGVAPADSSAHAPAPDQEPEVIARFTFDLTLDPRFTAPGRTLPIEEWVTVDDQRLLIRSLEINPTHARLTVVSDEANTAWCNGLDFYLSDADGNRYAPGSRASSGSNLISSGSGEEGVVVYYLESPHFDGKAPYTLHITGADWLDKDRAWVRIDLKNGRAQGLPENTRFISARRQSNGDVELTLSSQGPGDSQLFSWDYRDPEGNELQLTSGGYSNTEDDDGVKRQEYYFTLPDYPYDEVEMKLSRTRTAELDPEVTLEIK